MWGFALQSKLQRLYKGWEVSLGRLVAQFIRRNVILVHCTAQTEPLQSDAGGAVNEEDCVPRAVFLKERTKKNSKAVAI